MPGLLRNGRRLQLDLSGQTLNPHGLFMVSAVARGKPRMNASLCAPADFYAMPLLPIVWRGWPPVTACGVSV